MTSKIRHCAVSGCDKPYAAKGFCRNHYARVHKHGDPLKSRQTTGRGEAKEYLQSVVMEYEGTDCLLWPFSRSKQSGYATMKITGKKRLVSRVVCETAHGMPISHDLHAAHLCGNGHLGCVAKGHLLWKTPKENASDKLVHGTHPRGEKNGAAKLTEAKVREILSLKGTASHREIGRRFGVEGSSIRSIQSGVTWRWLRAEASA